MFEGDEDGGNGSLVSLRQVLGEILQEVDFVGDLESAEVGQRLRWVGKRRRARTMTLVLISEVMTESLLIRSFGDRLGSR